MNIFKKVLRLIITRRDNIFDVVAKNPNYVDNLLGNSRPLTKKERKIYEKGITKRYKDTGRNLFNYLDKE